MKNTKRLLINIMALLVILAVAYVANNNYAPREVKVAGITTSEKLQSIAKIVSDSHKGLLEVAYLNVSGQPGFIVLLESSATNNADTASQSKSMQGYASALATLLKLTAMEVLPTEPSIRYVVIEIVIKGEAQIYIADADELRALVSDASDRVWLAKLQVPPPPQRSSAPSSPSEPSSP